MRHSLQVTGLLMLLGITAVTAQQSPVDEGMVGTMSTTWTANTDTRILAPPQLMPDPGVMLMAGKDGSLYPSVISIDWKYLCDHRDWTEKKMLEACGK